MGKKKQSKEKSEAPMETEEEVEPTMEMPPDLPEQDIYEALKEFLMASLNAIRRLFSREREKETGKKLVEEEEEVGEEEEEEKKKRKKKKKKKKKKEMEPQEKVEHIIARTPNWPEQKTNEAPKKCETDAHNDNLILLSPEWMEQVEQMKEIVKNMGSKFTEEEIHETLKQCKMDPELTAQTLLSLEGFEKVKSKRTKKKERINAQECKSQHEVGSSSFLKQGGCVGDDAGRTDMTHDDTVQGLQGGAYIAYMEG